MFNFFKSLLSENFGDVSFTRVTSLFILVSVMGTWVYKNVVEVGFQDFGVNSVYIVLSVAFLKIGNKMFEVAGQIKEKELDKE